MLYTKCENCNVALEIDENDYIEGCREREDVRFPKCNDIATSVRISGFPSARVIEDNLFDGIVETFRNGRSDI